MGVCRSLCAFICPLINPGQCSLWPQSGQPEHSTLVKARYISTVLKSKRVQETAWKISTLAHSVSFFWASIFFLILPSFSELDSTYSLNYYKYSHSYLSTSGVCFHPPHLIPIALCLLKLHVFCLSTSSKKSFKTIYSNFPLPWLYPLHFILPNTSHVSSTCLFEQERRHGIPVPCQFFFLLHLYFVQADSIAHCPGPQSPLMWIGAYFMVLTSANYLNQMSQRTLFDHRLLPGGMPEPLQNYYVCWSLRNLIEWVF